MQIKEINSIDDHIGSIVKGKIKILDKFNNVILEKDNLVVLRGRTFLLEKLFSSINNNGELTTTVPSEGLNYINNANRLPILFTIGTGGAVSAGDSSLSSPSPFLPSYSDRVLVSPVPFVTTELGANQNKYFDRKNGNEYFGKAFKSVSWGYSSETNEVYKKLVLEVESNDARGNTISELGLVIGEPTYDSNNKLIAVKDTELMTRVTFTGIPLTTGDYFTIEYYLYS